MQRELRLGVRQQLPSVGDFSKGGRGGKPFEVGVFPVNLPRPWVAEGVLGAELLSVYSARLIDPFTDWSLRE